MAKKKANNEITNKVASILGIVQNAVASTNHDATIANTAVLGLPAIIPPVIPRVEHKPVVLRADKDTQAENDTEYARDNLFDVISKINEATDELMTVASQSQSPRAYEVLNQLLNTQKETAAALLKLHSDKAKANTAPAAPAGGGAKIANAYFIGTNAELLDAIKGKDRVQEQEAHDAEFYTDEE
jgi:hypothetical protein